MLDLEGFGKALFSKLAPKRKGAELGFLLMMRARARGVLGLSLVSNNKLWISSKNGNMMCVCNFLVGHGLAIEDIDPFK